MAIKGTLAAFNFSTLELATVDERRALRKELSDKGISATYLDVDKVYQLVSPFFITDVELVLIDHLENLLSQFSELMEGIIAVAKQHPSWYEAMNVQRLHIIINETKPALLSTKDAFMVLLSKQQNIPIRMQVLFNKIREDPSKTTKMAVGREVFQLLCDIAGTADGINAMVKLNEAHVNHSQDMAKRFSEGYIYHWTLEEEIKHIPFGQIFSKLPEMDKELFYQMAKLLEELANTAKAVYSLNWKHIVLLRRLYCLFFELAFKE